MSAMCAQLLRSEHLLAWNCSHYSIRSLAEYEYPNHQGNFAFYILRGYIFLNLETLEKPSS